LRVLAFACAIEVGDAVHRICKYQQIANPFCHFDSKMSTSKGSSCGYRVWSFISPDAIGCANKLGAIPDSDCQSSQMSSG
ncbi:hypothetical protein NPIL_472331, partial [Nephila pilipes]